MSSSRKRVWKYVESILPDLKKFRDELELIETKNVDRAEPNARLDEFMRLFTRPRQARILEASQVIGTTDLDDNLAVALMSLIVIREHFDGVVETTRLDTAEAELMMKRSFQAIIHSVDTLEGAYRAFLRPT